MTLKNKVILITGASSGIGMACAESFAREGANLLLCARRFEIIADLAEKLQSTYHVKTHVFQCDVRDHAAIKKQLSDLPDQWKTIDVLINNAGLAAGMDTIPEANVQDWEDMIDTNLKGLLYMTREISAQMLARKSGHIINIASISGYDVYPKGAVYCATKHAVVALSKGLRMDLLGSQVRVSVISPGAVETEFSLVRLKGDANRAAAVYEGFEPLKAEDIADAVLYCATRPLHVNVSEIIVMPTAQAAV
ncbi:MAG: SDR family NAD(P)-dependent oxidoreductase, partial [Gammaproteobacteria bacterium]|nr:SDR family NAD(P)-dependent oxidoreductase [Gammaproteobacteria bacterium]